MRLIPSLFAAAALLAAAPALAHPHVVKAAPANGSTVTGSPADIRITFSEAPFPRFSGVTITDAAGKKIATGATAISPTDKNQLVVPVRAALKPGAYKVDWFAVGADTHRVTGKFSFTVK